MPKLEILNFDGEWEDFDEPKPEPPKTPPPAHRHRVVHIEDVTLSPKQMQLWPDCTAGMTPEDKEVHFGDLPPRQHARTLKRAMRRVPPRSQDPPSRLERPRPDLPSRLARPPRARGSPRFRQRTNDGVWGWL